MITYMIAQIMVPVVAMILALLVASGFSRGIWFAVGIFLDVIGSQR